MVGGLLQLKEKGAQDLYLTGQPQITFFKIVYRRHTNFSIESIEQLFDTPPTSNTTRTINIDRRGDLIHKIYIQQQIPTNASFEDEGNTINYGYNYLKTVELFIGNKLIDSHSNNWMETYAELTQPNEFGNFSSAHNALFMNSAPNIGMGYTNGNNVSHTATKFQSMCMAGGVDKYDSINYFKTSGSSTISNASLIPSREQVDATRLTNTLNTDIVDGKPYLWTSGSNTLAVNDYAEYLYENEYHYIYTPLQFWFCRNIGLALPLIALQYNEVSINILFNKLLTDQVILTMYVDYIYLDTEERRRFSQISHEYLIEQVQTIKSNNLDEENLLNLNHPVKEIIWVSGDGENAYYPKALKGKWTIKINGFDRFTERDISYFTKQQVNDYHSGYGGVTKKNSIAVYSFALNPEDHQPSGTCNFSTINNAYLVCNLYNGQTADDEKYTLYAVNYNILRILSGTGSLGYV